MSMVVLEQDSEAEGRRLEGEVIAAGPQLFDKLRELTRNGYLPDASASAGEGMLLRHDTAPDLILLPDGTIDLPLTQFPKNGPAEPLEPAPQRRMAWFRTLAILILAATFWFLSVAITAGILEGM